MLHVFYLHQTGSNNPLGISSSADKIPFHSYYLYKDIFGFSVLLAFLMYFVLLNPLFFFEVDNFIPANPLVTPLHIVPEWYFLFAYSILRTIPSKIGGVIAMLSSLLVLFSLPFSHFSQIKSLSFYGPVKLFYWFFVSIFCLLTLSGSWPVLEPFITVTHWLTLSYFGFFAFLGALRHFWDSLVL